MRTCRDLGTLEWTLTGWAPYLWRAASTMELGLPVSPDHVVEPAPVPGSVQRALRDAGLLPDWNQAGKAQECEWVENRHWLYEATIPDDWLAGGGVVRLRCLGLDHSGWVLVNGVEVGEFRGTHVPHVFDLTAHLNESGNTLVIAFDLPPRWLGQFGHTSRFTEWKTRFNYTWDWQPRLVQLGIWDDIELEVVDGAELGPVRCRAGADLDTGRGRLHVSGEVTGGADAVTVTLRSGDRAVRSERLSPARFAAGVDWAGLDVELWWPNGQGGQPLYDVEVVAAVGDVEHDRRSVRVGFRDVAWRQCEGAPAGSDTWLCVVNGRPVFLQGVNFPPMSGLYADVTRDEYRARLELYRDLGVNTLRINACGFLEKRDFYELCDELGLLVWQDLPLTSSLLENVPPDDPASIEALGEIFASFIARRGHHASLFLWSGGNEQFRLESGAAAPIGTEHPMMARLARIAAELDPGRRFIPASPTGPRMSYTEADAGKGLHENVHGPYRPEPPEYWDRQDALFRAELASPAASDSDVIERHAGGLDPLPVSPDSPVWRRPSPWWVEIDAFVAEYGRDPRDLPEYVRWSQARQAESLAVAVTACKDRFPRTGGVLLWCGHDSYPTPANCSIVDVENTPKPAALRLREIWRRDFVG